MNNQKGVIDKIFLEERLYPSWSDTDSVYRIGIEIGGLSIAINTISHKLSELIKEEYGIFLSSKSDIDLSIDVQVKEVPLETKGGTDLVVVPHREETLFVRRPFFAGIVNFKQKRAKLNLMHWDASGIQDALRFLTPHFLIPLKGMLLHASSIVESQKGFIFCGKSGVGKTTIARLSKEYTILTDEISIVREVNGEFRVFSSPYWGEIEDIGEEIKKVNLSIEIGAIFFPIQDRKIYLKRLSFSESIHKIMSNLLFTSTESGLNKKRDLFNLCDKLLNRIPCYELYFLPNSLFWGEIRRYIINDK